MRILALADEESKALWEHYEQNKITDTDLLISCGDLDPRYLSFLVTLANTPLLYVHGNHDDIYEEVPPEGCTCIDDRIYVHNDIRILGLGGCVPYKQGNHMYTERQMMRRIHRLKLKLMRFGGFDILVTHAPLHGYGDGEDLVHRGYDAFYELLDHYSPKYMLHGHNHLQYDHTLQRMVQYKDTTIVNAYEKCYIEF